MEIINLTPHEVVFYGDDNNIVATVAPSGTIARLSQTVNVVEHINGIPVTEIVYGDVEGIPEEGNDAIYIVSSLVAQQCRQRRDVFIPANPVRDGEGRIVGCRSLGRV